MPTRQLLLFINSTFSLRRVLFSSYSPLRVSSSLLFPFFKEFSPIISRSRLYIFFSYSPSFSVTLLVISWILFFSYATYVFLRLTVFLSSLSYIYSLAFDELLIDYIVFSCFSMISAIYERLTSRSLHLYSYSFIVFYSYTMILIFSCSAICASVRLFPFSEHVLFASLSYSCCKVLSADNFMIIFSFSQIYLYFSIKSSSFIRISDISSSMTLPSSFSSFFIAYLPLSSSFSKVSTNSVNYIFSFSSEPIWLNNYDTYVYNFLFYSVAKRHLFLSYETKDYCVERSFPISSITFSNESFNSLASFSCFSRESISSTNSCISPQNSPLSLIYFFISFSACYSWLRSNYISSCF